jgi:glycosyltransferase involved in cell wall biosynthesis
MIPVSVLVATKNEEKNLGRCLEALKDFSEIVVIDSNSTDETKNIALRFGARVENFTWDGKYPKKRQWCLENLKLKHDWIFFVDADEIVTSTLKAEISKIFQSTPEHDGYFVKGRYVWGGKILGYGLSNNKIVLFDRRKIHFPAVNDLDLPGMGEMEGHYQPVLKNKGSLGQLLELMLHYCEDRAAWNRRHERYADWEAGMNRKGAWPADPDSKRQKAKEIFRALPFRPAVAVLHSYVWKRGFLDGREGLDFALSRGAYYRMIEARSSSSRTVPAQSGVRPSSGSDR